MFSRIRAANRANSSSGTGPKVLWAPRRERAKLVQWVTSDVTTADLHEHFDVWHDRAVFHFLTGLEDRKSYVARLRSALARDGAVIIATFGPDGPTRCSGLPVRRYGPEELQRELGNDFELVHSELATHVTPSDKDQQFLYASFRRT